jgi:hypothetical protein
MRSALAELPDGGDLLSFVPRLPKGEGAVAGTQLASLEMARESESSLGKISILAQYRRWRLALL